MLLLRLIAWKVCFLLLETFRGLWVRLYPVKVWHFAFGANVSPETLQVRKMTIFSAEDLLLTGFEMRFDRPGPYKGLGFANVYENKDAVVYGRLYQMYAVDCLRMDFFEGVPFMKRHQRVWKEQDGKTFYFYQGSSLSGKNKYDASVRPTSLYLEKIRQAMANADITIPQQTKDVVDAQEAFAPANGKIEPLRFFWLESKPHLPAIVERCRQLYDRFLSQLSMWWYPHKPMGLGSKRDSS